MKLISAEFLPAVFSAGMRVQVFARLELGSGFLPEGTLKPVNGVFGGTEPSIHAISLKKDGKYFLYTVAFTSWEPGQGELPPLPAGTEILPAISIMTASSLNEDASLPPPRAQREPEGVRLRVYFFVGMVLLAVSAGVFSVLALPKIASSFFARRTVKRTRKLFFRLLAELEKNAGSGPDSWLRLCSALRGYLGFRLESEAPTWQLPIPLAALTAREFSRLPCDSLPGSVHGEFAAILLRADTVRWAGRIDENILQAVRDIRRAVEKLETALSEKQLEIPVSSGGCQ